VVAKHKKALSIIGVIVGVILIAGCIFIVNAFTGNPISQTIAKHKIQKYIHEVYSADGEVGRPRSSFPDRGYFSEVKVDNQTITMKYYAHRITDENVTNYFQNKLNDDYPAARESFSHDDLAFPEPDIYTAVIADGHYHSDFEKLNVRQKLYVLGVENHDKKIPENDSGTMPSKIASHLINELGDRYNFTSIQLIYTDKFGVYEIAIDDTNLTIDELLKNTRKFDDSEIGEVESAFIESLNR
jgi:hypothetical protein